MEFITQDVWYMKVRHLKSNYYKMAARSLVSTWPCG